MQHSKENFPRALGTAEVQTVLCEDFVTPQAQNRPHPSRRAPGTLHSSSSFRNPWWLPHPSCSPGQADPHPHVPRAVIMEHPS